MSSHTSEYRLAEEIDTVLCDIEGARQILFASLSGEMFSFVTFCHDRHYDVDQLRQRCPISARSQPAQRLPACQLRQGRVSARH